MLTSAVMWDDERGGMILDICSSFDFWIVRFNDVVCG